MFNMVEGIRQAYDQWSTHLFEVFGTANRA